MAMDIELNPGPVEPDTINSLDILHLNVRSIRKQIRLYFRLSRLFPHSLFVPKHI